MTDEVAAKKILSEGFKCGSSGIFGPGIYFGESKEQCL